MTVEGALVIKLSGDKSHDQRLYLDQNAVTTGNSRTTIINPLQEMVLQHTFIAHQKLI